MAKKAGKPTKKRAEPEITAAPETVTGDEGLGAVFSVSARTVQSWRNRGLPCQRDGRSFIFNVEEARKWVDLFRRSTETTTSTPGGKIKLSRERAKLRIDRAKAAQAEREELAAGKNILKRDEWELYAIEVVQQARDRLMRLPKMLCRHVPQKFHRILQAEGDADVRKILNEMARALAEGVKE